MSNDFRGGSRGMANNNDDLRERWDTRNQPTVYLIHRDKHGDPDGVAMALNKKQVNALKAAGFTICTKTEYERVESELR